MVSWKTTVIWVQEGTPTLALTQDTGCTVRISLFSLCSSLSSSSIRAPAAFLVGAKRKKEIRLVNFKASSHFSSYV